MLGRVLKPATAGVAAVLLLVTGGVIGAAWWADARATSPLSSDTRPSPLVVPVTRTEHTVSIGVGVKVSRRDGDSVASPAAGTVTRVAAAVGDTLKTGTVVASIDDLPIVAMVGAAPLWRDLVLGDNGPDVKRLQAFLGDLGLLTPAPDGRFGPDTAAAVRAFNKTVGREKLGAAFALSSVVWVGKELLTVAGVSAREGDVVAAGQTLVTGPSTDTAIEVSEPAGGVPIVGMYDLVVGDTRTPYIPGSGAVTDRSAVSAIAALLGTTGEGAGRIVSTSKTSALSVPASAVVQDASGATCVFTDTVSAPVDVTPVGGDLATTLLPADTPINEVLANPYETRTDTSCG